MAFKRRGVYCPAKGSVQLVKGIKLLVKYKNAAVIWSTYRVFKTALLHFYMYFVLEGVRVVLNTPYTSLWPAIPLLTDRIIRIGLFTGHKIDNFHVEHSNEKSPRSNHSPSLLHPFLKNEKKK